jgi:hypothetical protein
MADSFSETTSQGWISRLVGSIKSVVVGLVFVVVSFPLLFWNEGRAVRTARSLEEGAGIVVSVAPTSVDPAKDGTLVHVSGPARTEDTLADPMFGVSANAIKLIRDVEMYQWDEEKESKEEKKLGGGTETKTTYTYRKTWSSRVIDSSGFRESQGHENPSRLPVEEEKWVASKVTLGAFTLSAPVLDQLNETEDVPVDASRLPAPMKTKVQASANSYYMGNDPATPEVGDVRITFRAVRPATISVVARQVADSFAPYAAQAGDEILLVDYGERSAAQMFKAAQDANTMLTWLLRFVGFFVMFLGLVMAFRPIVVFADVVPLFGTLLGAGIGVFAGLTAVILSLLTIAVAWIFYRPILALTLVALAAGSLVLLVRIGLKRKRARAEAPAAARQGAA